MKRILTLFSLNLLFISLYGQDGARLLTHFKEGNEIDNQNWSICQDDHKVMLFANRTGILTFDGQGWSFISMPSIPFTINYNLAERKVYVGGENDYGYLQRDERGVYQYISFSGGSQVGLISKIIFTDTTVYFYGEQSISRHDLKSGKLELRLLQKENRPYTGMFITPKNTFINVSAQGLFRLESDTLFPIVTGYLTKDQEILFGLPYNHDQVLIGKSNGELSLFDGIKSTDYQINDEGYLKQNILSEGLSVSDSLYAFSTLEGGALVIDKYRGKIKYTINYVNGLPDDEVFALGIDDNHGLWISHQYGLTRADMNLPIDNFSIYPGLKGNLITSLWHKNELYIATSEGVYYLKEVKNYSEVEILVGKGGRQEPPTVSATGKMYLLPQAKEPRKTRKSIFTSIFGRKTEVTETPVSKEKVVPQEPVLTAPRLKLPEPKYFKKVAGRLKSINYTYNKVEGLNEKCKQLIPAGNEILVSTNKGLYVISDHKAKTVEKNGYINSISSCPYTNRFFVGTTAGFYYVSRNGLNHWEVKYPDSTFNHPVYSVKSTDENTIWASSDGIVYRLHVENGIATGSPEKFTVKDESLQRYLVESVNDTLFLFTQSGINYFDNTSETFIDYKKQYNNDGSKLKFSLTQPGIPWIKTQEEWINLNSARGMDLIDKSLLKIFDNLTSITTDENNLWVVTADNRIYRILRHKILSIKPDVGLFIRSISDARGLNLKLSDIVFGSGDNTVYFDMVAPGYLKLNSARYQHIVDNEMTEWSKWSYTNTITLMIKPGKYTLRVRAKDIWGNVSEPRLINFTIEAPFTQTTYFYLVIFIALLILIIGIIRFRERQLIKEKRILEVKVKERTAQIEAQKHEITSSIEYASRIQMAMLPEDFHFRKSFSDYFIIFSPRDIVSGDFYWIGEKDKHIYFTVADCTGHGVPGAFMSTLGISTLDEIITNNNGLKANEILNLLREKVKTSLHQTGKQGEATDGMDVAFCILHRNRKMLEYSGAYNPLFHFHKGGFTEYRADRMPIGIYYGEKETFTNHQISVQKGDTIYIFSDGYADQFGGPKESRYMKYNLKKLLEQIYFKPMEEQRVILENEFEKWKGTINQVDDVTILGVRI